MPEDKIAEAYSTTYVLPQGMDTEWVPVGEWKVPSHLEYVINMDDLSDAWRGPVTVWVSVRLDPKPRVATFHIEVEGKDASITRTALAAVLDDLLPEDVAIRALVMRARPDPFDTSKGWTTAEIERVQRLPADKAGHIDIPVDKTPLFRLLKKQTRLHGVDLERVAALYREAVELQRPTGQYIAERLPIHQGKDPANQANQFVSRARKAGFLPPVKRK